MSYPKILQRYSGQSENPPPGRQLIKLPRVWPGLTLSVIGSLWSFLDFLHGSGKWTDPFPFGSLLIMIYWYFCVYRINSVARGLNGAYKLRAGVVTALTVIPNLLLVCFSIAMPEVSESMPPDKMLVVVVLLLAGLCTALFAVFWQFFWTWQLTALFRSLSLTNMGKWLPGAILGISYVVGIFNASFALFASFALLLYWVQKLKPLAEDETNSPENDETIGQDATNSKKTCNECKKNSLADAKFCNSCGARFFGDTTAPAVVFSKSSLTSILVAPISKNSYRLLNIRCTESQSAVAKAVSALRRSAKLGIKRRGMIEIAGLPESETSNQALQEAANRLSHPESRIEERLFWFYLDPSLHEQESIDATSSLFGLHDKVLNDWIQAAVKDPEFSDKDLWQKVIMAWLALTADENFWKAFRYIEKQGGFEPEANEREFKRLQQSAPKLAINAIAKGARLSLRQNHPQITRSAIAVLRSVEDNYSWDFESEICGELESELASLCESIEEECSQKVRRIDENTKDDEEYNRWLCNSLKGRFDNDVIPKLNQIESIVGTESSLFRRCREIAALCLQKIALGFTWSEDFDRAEKCLQTSLGLGKGTLVQGRIEESLEKISEQLRQSEIFRNLTPVKSAPPLINFFGLGFNTFSNPFKKQFEDPVLNSYMATYALTFLWLPIIPLQRFRVVALAPGRTLFLAKGSLRTFDRFHQLVGITLIAWCFFGYHPVSTPSTVSTGQTLSEPAEESTNASESSETSAPSTADDNSLIARQTFLRKKIDECRSQSEQAESRLKQKRVQFEGLKELLDQSKSAVQGFEYQVKVNDPALDEAAYKTEIEKFNGLVRKHNKLLKSVNAEVYKYNSLIKQEKKLIDEYNATITQQEQK